MLGLLFVLFLTAASLIVLLWMGAFFFQGYIYTEPSPGLFWQAPAAGIFLTIGYTIWAFAIAFNPNASPTNIPVNTIFRFTPWEDLLDRPVPKLWAIKMDRRKTTEFKDGDKIEYNLARDDRGNFIYRDTTVLRRPWQPQDVIAIEMPKTDGSIMRFDVAKNIEAGQYRQFVSPEGWVIMEYDHPTGLPIRFNFFRLIMNIVFNVAHFLGWFFALWVLLRFQWAHALGLAVVAWLVHTILILPMLLFSAAEVAASRQTRTAMEWVWVMVA